MEINISQLNTADKRQVMAHLKSHHPEKLQLLKTDENIQQLREQFGAMILMDEDDLPPELAARKKAEQQQQYRRDLLNRARAKRKRFYPGDR